MCVATLHMCTPHVLYRVCQDKLTEATRREIDSRHEQQRNISVLEEKHQNLTREHSIGEQVRVCLACIWRVYCVLRPSECTTLGVTRVAS
jgi:hypothetical protein